MKFIPLSSAIALLGLAGIATQSGIGAKPLKVLGGKRALAALRAVNPRDPYALPEPFAGPVSSESLKPRKWKNPPDKKKKQCGPGFGSCDPGYCCSIGGHCGTGYHYCSGPACQLSYGDSCDGNAMPGGTATLEVERPLIGNVTYNGTGIYNCLSDDKIALTFDDGPFNFTWHLLDVLASYGAKATFFITGNNMGKGQIDIEETGYPETIRRMHREGHQIAHHSWTHQNFTALTEQQLMNQIHYNEMAFRNILGFFPTYFRPPYSECNEVCQSTMQKLGYHITYYSLITDDYMYDDPTKIQASKDKFDGLMDEVNNTAVHYITISHDNHYQTAYNLTNYMLDYMKSMKYGTSVTVGECLGDPPENWYRNASGAPQPATLLKLEKPTAASSKVNAPSSLVYTLGTLFAVLFVLQ